MFTLRSILNRATRSGPLNILTFCTHERYEQNLCKTGHNFYSLKQGKTWDRVYGEIPKNYFEIDEAYLHVDFDLILCHTSDERFQTALNISRHFDIPIIRHCHVLPDTRFDVKGQVKAYKVSAPYITDSFISAYNRDVWEGAGEVIEHGVDYNTFNDRGLVRMARCLSAVNFWKDRDWACGWNLWKYIINEIPHKVIGNNPGLSLPVAGDDLINEYNNSLIFLNTSLQSPVPTVLLEAMSCACAIVTTDTCMISDIIENGVNGFKSNDPDELRDMIKELMKNPGLAIEIGQNARKTIIDKFSIERFTNDWNTLFNKVVDNYENTLINDKYRR